MYFIYIYKNYVLRGKKLSWFLGFYPNPRKFIPAKFFKRRDPRTTREIFLKSEYSEKNTLL